jgi:chromosome partitioning protein
MTRIFALTNHKGGVGKSTSATNLAYGILMLMEKAGVKQYKLM